MTDNLFRIRTVRLPNPLRKLRDFAAAAFGVTVLLFCAYQL
jgi:hypothetical protein